MSRNPSVPRLLALTALLAAGARAASYRVLDSGVRVPVPDGYEASVAESPLDPDARVVVLTRRAGRVAGESLKVEIFPLDDEARSDKGFAGHHIERLQRRAQARGASLRALKDAPYPAFLETRRGDAPRVHLLAPAHFVEFSGPAWDDAFAQLVRGYRE